jgi:hypothetical protein
MPVTIRTPTSVPGYNAIVLQPIPELDAIIAWRQFTGVLLVLTVPSTIKRASLIFRSAARVAQVTRCATR